MVVSCQCRNGLADESLIHVGALASGGSVFVWLVCGTGGHQNWLGPRYLRMPCALFLFVISGSNRSTGRSRQGGVSRALARRGRFQLRGKAVVAPGSPRE